MDLDSCSGVWCFSVGAQPHSLDRWSITFYKFLFILKLNTWKCHFFKVFKIVFRSKAYVNINNKIDIITSINIFIISNGTSMISLIIPPKDQISRVSKMLADEYGTASNIKSRVNRLSVLGAITSVQQRLKLYTKGDFFKLYYINSFINYVLCLIISSA